MLKIERFPEERMTLDDYKKMKKHDPYKKMRTNAKFVNFGLTFGESALAFGLGTLRDNWDEHDCDVCIEDHGLYERINELSDQGKFDPLEIKYIVCAEFIRSAWFDLYTDIEAWIKHNAELGMQKGYIRSPFGARRLSPELTYIGEDSNQRRIKNLKNIMANSPVQNHEAVFVNRAQLIICNYIKEHHLQSRVIGNVHDATVKYLAKDEAKQLLPIIHQAFCMDYPENNGIPIEGESDLADLAKGEAWGFGSIEVGPKDVLKGDFEKVTLEAVAKAPEEKEEKDDYFDPEEMEDLEGDYY